MKFKSLAILFLTGSVANSTFADTNLPFVGKGNYNFQGGNATDETITIRKDGIVSVKFDTTSSVPRTLYIGKFNNPLKVYYPFYNTTYYYKIYKNTIEMLDKNKQAVMKCGNPTKDELPFLGYGNTKCVQKLH